MDDFLLTILNTGSNLESLIDSKPTERGNIFYRFVGLETLKESKINCNTAKLIMTLKNTKLKPNRKIISFDLKSPYTNVPVNEAIEMSDKKLFDRKIETT